MCGDELYRTLFEQSPDGIIVVDPETALPVFYNDRALELLGYSREEFAALGTADFEALLAEEHIRGHLETMLSSGSDRFEIRVRKKSGEVLHVQTFSRLVSVAGKCYFQNVFRDITTQKQTEAALRESEERFDFVLKGSELGYWDWNIETGEVQRNERWAGMLGYTLQEIEFTVNQWTDLIHPDDRALAWQAINDHLMGVTPTYKVEYRMLCKDGQYKWILDRAGIVQRHADGRPLRMSGTHADITDRRRAADDLRQLASEWQATFDATNDVVWLLDPEWRVKRSNRKAAETFSRPVEDMLGKHCWEIACGSERPDPGCPVFHMRESLRRESCEMKIGDRWFEIAVDPILDDKGELTGIVHIMSDCTEQIRMEEQLRTTQKLDSIGVLAGGIAHDFNNLLCGIVGNISLARMMVETGNKAADLLLNAESACDSASQLSHRLLTFAKGGEPVLKATDIRDLLANSIDFALSGSNVAAQFDIAKGLPVLRVDVGQMRQVFSNLALNARDAMPAGGTLYVSAEHVRDQGECCLAGSGGTCVNIGFRDEGPGIRPEIISRVFDPYFSTKEMGSRKGQGLGLSICHTIVTKHGGNIRVVSAPGEGATFTICLPVVEPDGETLPDTGAAEDAGEIVPNRHILVMDDEEWIRTLLRDMLQHFGHRTMTTPDSRSAVEAYRAALEQDDPFDVVILDLTIPGGSGGLETLNELRRISPGIRAVISSGYSDDPIMTDYQQYGFTAAIAKPYTTSCLRELLDRVMDDQ
jgi:PAS domain S-box-containing protein